MTSQLRIPCVCTKPSAVCIYTCSDSVLVICCVSTDRGESRLTEAEARNPVQGTRGNVFYLPIPPDMAKKPGQEGAVTNSGGITNHSDVLACPRNSHIDAPAVAQKPYGSQWILPNLELIHRYILISRSTFEMEKEMNCYWIGTATVNLVHTCMMQESEIEQNATMLTIDMITASASLP